jgi:hypothetical protein
MISIYLSIFLWIFPAAAQLRRLEEELLWGFCQRLRRLAEEAEDFR